MALDPAPTDEERAYAQSFLDADSPVGRARRAANVAADNRERERAGQAPLSALELQVLAIRDTRAHHERARAGSTDRQPVPAASRSRASARPVLDHAAIYTATNATYHAALGFEPPAGNAPHQVFAALNRFYERAVANASKPRAQAADIEHTTTASSLPPQRGAGSSSEPLDAAAAFSKLNAPYERAISRAPDAA